MNKHAQLTDILVEKTAAGTAKWEPTSKDDTFALSLADFTVRISAIPTREPGVQGQDTLIEIVNSGGAIIDSFTDVELAAETGARPEATYKKMNSLYTSARRAALGVDAALDKLIEELDRT